jgi:DUF917 family protein/N-methylhydantoinase A/oxoprolinase/acetone carboxylase beta subunit
VFPDFAATNRTIGTNTDAVLISLSPIAIIASTKAPTTDDVTTGIVNAIKAVISSSGVSIAEISCVIIGTTHFVNAVVQRSRHLQRVAVIRLCGGGAFGSRVPPFVDFPPDLRKKIQSKTYFCQGGHQIDGSEISSVDEAEIKRIADQLVADGDTNVVVASIYSPLNAAHEEKVGRILQERMEEQLAKSSNKRKARVTLSHRISSLGFLARENASILNATLRPLAEATIKGFLRATEGIFEKSACPLFLTQNDGSVLQAAEAMDLPIRTFNSGPTNSIRGGAFLWNAAGKEAERTQTSDALVVIDIGGTTSDSGLLLPNGLPRMSSVMSYVGGVRTNFALPAVESIGLGGGSVVREGLSPTVGPDSVGHELLTKGRLFGGSTLTATDIMSARSKGHLEVGDPTLLADIPQQVIDAAEATMRRIIEGLVDRTKIQRGEVDVLIVGGGAMIINPEKPLAGVRNVRKVKGGEVANAVGAAISQVAGLADKVIDTSHITIKEAKEQVIRLAVDSAIKNGAKPATIEVVEITVLPVQYVDAKARIVVRAMGDLDTVVSRQCLSPATSKDSTEEPDLEPNNFKSADAYSEATQEAVHEDLSLYRPEVVNNEWILSVTDLYLISIGCKILGCGGGGESYYEYLKSKTILETSPGCLRVIDPRSLADEATVGWTGDMGSPEVSLERMEADECTSAQSELMRFLQIPRVDAMVALEIGGANGLVNLGVAASNAVPTVDADYMGRAYPTMWQTTANVYDLSGRGLSSVPAAIASGDGSFMLMSQVKTDKLVDRALRAACVEMGCRAGYAARPQTGAMVREQAVANTISLAWRLGRAVQMEKNIADIAQTIIEAAGGNKSARKIAEGKVVSVERVLKTGHTYGTLEVDGHAADGSSGLFRIPFKNENIYVEAISSTATSHDSHVLVSVPDLIIVLDAETGYGLSIADYKYGLKVVIIAMAASPRWTDTARGIELGGPASMGFEKVDYRPVGVYSRPRSVIEEYR